MTAPEIVKALVLSTGHVSQATAKKLDGPAISRLLMEPDNGEWKVFAPNYYPMGEYGWFAHVEKDPAVRAYMPDDLRACFDFAIEHGCDWLMFDRDGDRIEQIPYHEW